MPRTKNRRGFVLPVLEKLYRKERTIMKNNREQSCEVGPHPCAMSLLLGFIGQQKLSWMVHMQPVLLRPPTVCAYDRCNISYSSVLTTNHKQLSQRTAKLIIKLLNKHDIISFTEHIKQKLQEKTGTTHLLLVKNRGGKCIFYIRKIPRGPSSGQHPQ